MLMKLRVYLPVITAISLAAGALHTAQAQNIPPAAPGRSVQVPTSMALYPATVQPVAIDPNTGLPMPVAPPQYIDPQWSPPALVLTNVNWDGLPLSEVTFQLREDFKDSFDILPFPENDATDWGSTIINLKLVNARANDVINAMNLVFENNQRPVRWHLEVHDGHAYLILKEIRPAYADQVAAQPKVRQIFFVGDLLNDDKTNGLTMQGLNDTIADIWNRTYGTSADDVIRFHQSTQLLIFNGTPEQAAFLQQILEGLKQRVQWTQFKLQSEAGGFTNPFGGMGGMGGGHGAGIGGGGGGGGSSGGAKPASTR